MACCQELSCRFLKYKSNSPEIQALQAQDDNSDNFRVE
jgi:hypothetical protein